MNSDILQNLIDSGYADEAGIAADVIDRNTGAAQLLCVNGEIITLADGNPPRKVFTDSIDKLSDVVVKSGLFKKTLSFTYGGKNYVFTVKSGKTLTEYFKLLSEE